MEQVLNKIIEEQAFIRDGFIVFKNFLSKDEIFGIQHEVEHVLSSGSEFACVRPNNMLLPLRWNDLLVEFILKSESRMEELKKGVNAGDLKWISGYVSTKDAYSPPLWWHQDWWCWQHEVSFKRNASQVALMCYLTDTTKENGALKVLPGTHHKSSSLHALLPEAHTHEINDVGEEHIAMSDRNEQITLNLNAGDAVAIDYRLLHGTHGNATKLRRDCVMLTFAPAWKELPEDIKGHLINHHALPNSNELPFRTAYEKSLLPTFEGIRKDLQINRTTPPVFEVMGN